MRARGRGRGRSAHLWHLVLRLDFASEKTKSTQECGMGALALTPQADWSRPLAAVAAARRWASHVRAAAAAPLPPLRGDGQAHSSSAGQKGLLPLCTWVGSVLVVFFSVAAGSPLGGGG